MNSESVPAADFTREGAIRVKVRHLIDEHHGSGKVVLNLYSIEKGGHTPLERHEYEHQAYILKGKGALKKEQETMPLREGNVIHVPSNALHQFINENEEPLIYLLINAHTD